MTQGQHPPWPPGSGAGPDPPDRLHRFLRYSHIFSAAVHDILESHYLAQVAKDPITLPQFHLLRLISLNGNHQVGEVAECLGVSAPAASKNIDKLERMKLVTRRTDKEDRRATILSASRKGKKLVAQYETFTEERLTPVLRMFRTEEIDQMARLLERFSVLWFAEERPPAEMCLRCAGYCEDRCPVGHVLGNCAYEKMRTRRRSAEPVQEVTR